MPYIDPATLPGETGLLSFGAWICAPGTTYGPYSWSVHQFIWVIDGSATIRSGDEVFEVPPDGVFYTPAGLEYFITWDPRRPTRIGFADFMPGSAADLPRLRLLSADDVVVTLLNHLVWLGAKRPADWMSAASQAFDYVLRAYGTGESASRIGLDGLSSELVARATSAVYRHWRGGRMFRISLDELATELGASKANLARAFAEELGVGPVTTFRMMRILEGARFLTRTTLSLRDIAERVGFANEFHFSRAFKTATGFSPTQYRTQAPDITRIPQRVIHFHHFRSQHFHPRELSDENIELAPVPDREPESRRSSRSR